MKILRTLLSAKKLAIFLLAGILALALVACENTNGNVPYGSISDGNYLELGGYTVTNKELYNNLRTSSLSRLTSVIDKLVFKDVELDTANLSDFEVKAFETEINTALFSNATISPKNISEMTDEQLAQRILSFADSFVITNPGTDKDLLIAYLEAIMEDAVAYYESEEYDEDADYEFGYTSIAGFNTIVTAVIKQYTLPVLKQVYAKSLLGEVDEDGNLSGELADEDSTAYISEAQAVTYYKNNIAGRYDVNALVIQFASVKENELARYKYAIKSTSRGEWYFIPNLNDPAVIAAIKADNYDDTSSLGKAKKIITDSLANGGLGIDLADLDVIDYRTPQFATYYSKYTLQSAVDNNFYSRILGDEGTENEVLYYFLKIYDDLNSTKYAPDNIEDLADADVRADIEEAFKMVYTNPVFTGNTQLRNYVYGLDKESLYLETKSGPNEDGKTYGRPYSRQVQTFNNKSYLVYLLNDNREADKDVLDETDAENPVFWITDDNENNENAKAIYIKSLKALEKSRLTAAYITSKVNEKYESATVDIFDPIFREFYRDEKGYSGSEGFEGNDLLARVNGDNILVDDFFEELDNVLGLSTALDIILMKKLRTTYGGEITEELRAEFREDFEAQYVNPFLANQYETAGFPASMGIEKFLLLGFGAWDREGKGAMFDAIDRAFVQSKLRDLFEEDLTKHFASDEVDNNIYTKFAELSSIYKQNAVGISASHLLIYLDLNQDGTPDNPNNIKFEDANLVDLNGNEITDMAGLEAVIGQFIQKINERASLSTSMSEGLNAVVSAYNSATRFELSLMSLDDLGPNPTPEQVLEFINKYNREDVWVPFKRLGLQLKFETLGEITNTTNFPGGSSRLDQDFFDYAMALADHLKDAIETDKIEPNQLLPLYAPSLGSSEVNGGAANFTTSKTRSGFGWHLILVTGYTQPSSAKAEGDEGSFESKIENPYVEGTKLSGLNDTDDITWEQILIYLEESKEETGVVTLPTSVVTAITKYFTPIQTAYNNSYAQLEIAFNFIFDGNIQLGNASQNTKLQALRDANLNQFFNYAYFAEADGSGSIYDRATNAQYAAIYSQWYDILRG